MPGSDADLVIVSFAFVWKRSGLIRLDTVASRRHFQGLQFVQLYASP